MHTRTSTGRSCALAVCVIALLAVLATAPGLALAETDPPKPVEGALQALAGVLGRLEAELAALEAPAAERLEEGLEQAIELIENLLDELATRQEEADGGDVRGRIVELDLMLHRLLYVLDEIVENARPSPARPRARAALHDLKDWVDGYIDGATAGMSPAETARFERAARDMIRSLVGQLADMARAAQGPDRGRPVLARLVERLEELLFRLDGLILRRAGPPSDD